MEVFINEKVQKYIDKNNWNLSAYFEQLKKETGRPPGWSDGGKGYWKMHVPGSSDDEFYATINGNKMQIRAIYDHPRGKGKNRKAGDDLGLK